MHHLIVCQDSGEQSRVFNVLKSGTHFFYPQIKCCLLGMCIKKLISIANRKDFDQTASSEAI